MRNYILWATALLMAGLSACEPMKDVYEELDSVEKPNAHKIEYTLVASDYQAISKAELQLAGDDAEKQLLARAIASNLALNDKEEAIRQVPTLLKGYFPALQSESAVQVYYQMNEGVPASLEVIRNADAYVLNADDYLNAGINGYFSPSFPAAKFMSPILKVAFPEAMANDQVLVNYQYSSVDPEGLIAMEIFREEFSADLGSFTTQSVIGDGQNWLYAVNKEDHFAKMTGYNNVEKKNFANEDWLISPVIDLTNYVEPTLSVVQAINFLKGKWDEIKVMVSVNYNGTDVTAASWTELTIENKPTGDNWTFVTSEEIDLSAFEGKKIHVAFRYTSNADVVVDGVVVTPGNASTWEVDAVWVNAKNKSAAKVAFAAGPSVTREYYQYNGTTWAPVVGVYALANADYAAMGTPGKYNNFSATDKPENYLPAFLGIKYPYAQEGNIVKISYNFYTGQATVTNVDEYRFSMGSWSKVSYLVAYNDQFVNVDGAWVFDPTVKFAMSKADFGIIVAAVKADPNLSKFVDKFGTSEVYYGASEYYGNFDLRLASRDPQKDPAFAGLDVNGQVALTWVRVEESINLMLARRHPDATAMASGLDWYFWVSFNTYENDLSKKIYTGIFQVVTEGAKIGFARVKEVEDQMVKEGKLAAEVVNWNR